MIKNKFRKNSSVVLLVLTMMICTSLSNECSAGMYNDYVGTSTGDYYEYDYILGGVTTEYTFNITAVSNLASYVIQVDGVYTLFNIVNTSVTVGGIPMNSTHYVYKNETLYTDDFVEEHEALMFININASTAYSNDTYIYDDDGVLLGGTWTLSSSEIKLVVVRKGYDYTYEEDEDDEKDGIPVYTLSFFIKYYFTIYIIKFNIFSSFEVVYDGKQNRIFIPLFTRYCQEIG